MKKTAIIEFIITKRNMSVDLEVPLDISADDLLFSLNEAFVLNIPETENPRCCLKAEYPAALLKGSGKLRDFGIGNGTMVFYTG